MAFDKSKFIDRFKSETREHIEKLNLGLLKLEKSPSDKVLLEEMMREAHTIKGSATMMGYKRIADITHRMEDGLEKALKGEMILSKIHFDVLFRCLDVLEPLLEDKVTWPDKGIERPFVENLCKEAEDIFSGKVKEVKKEEEKLEKKEEVKQKDTEPVKSPAKLPAAASVPVQAVSTVSQETIRIDLEKLDNLVNISGELLVSKIRLNELVRNLTSKVDTEAGITESFVTGVKELNTVNENIGRLTENLQGDVMKVRMVPVSYLFNTFPRAMRDLAREKGKEIDFHIQGEDTQLDKAMLDEMKDPLMHLLRNAVDHGIESPKERIKNSKPAQGRITLSAYHEGSQIVIEVHDDGSGINLAKVKEYAVKKGLVAKDKINEMFEEQVYQLLFVSGFSTKEEISETSGRGVGLDVVREKISNLKGMVEVKSKEGSGSRFIMRLPLTLAITESLLVVAGSDVFAIPVDAVVETIRINSDDIKTIETKDAITVRHHILPLVRLNDVFGLPRRGIIEKRFMPVVIVQSVEKRIALLVDQITGRQDIVTKAIGDPLKKVKNIAGATILGSGKVILILDIPSIIESSEGVVIRRPVSVEKALPSAAKKKKRNILLAEDVLSTAMLEKNILESVGYSVVIAHDGKEALERSKQESFDLVITDVLMPRMDGFELVAELRKDKMYKEVPIVIVTTRESDADKRRGMEAGADAYLLKSEFTSEGLLDTLDRLLG